MRNMRKNEENEKGLGWGRAEAQRQWTVADAKGLFLMDVQYPPHDNPEELMYPDLPHDQYGRVWIGEPGSLDD
jgi:hypothetical protein